MEAIHQARKLFVKCHQYEASLTEIDKQQLERDIQRFITIAIKEVVILVYVSVQHFGKRIF